MCVCACARVNRHGSTLGVFAAGWAAADFRRLAAQRLSDSLGRTVGVCARSGAGRPFWNRERANGAGKKCLTLRASLPVSWMLALTPSQDRLTLLGLGLSFDVLAKKLERHRTARANSERAQLGLVGHQEPVAARNPGLRGAVSRKKKSAGPRWGDNGASSPAALSVLPL